METGIYKLIGVNPEADQKWSAYLRSMLAFSAVSVLFLYGLERLQHYLLLSLGMANVPPALAFNTAASFVTNTNWQNYSGESTMGYLVQMAGLAVQNFLSAARRPGHRHRPDPRASSGRGPTRWATSGWTSPGPSPGCCCRWPWWAA